jgi:lipid A 3-O-deacylase
MTRRLIATHTFVLAAAFSATALTAARATPQQDPASIVTIQVENDAVSTLKGTSDQNYTSGLRLGWVSGTNQVPSLLEQLGRGLWGDGVPRVSLGLSQQIYTPRDTQAPVPGPRDRPYATSLLLTGQLIHDTDMARSVVSLQAGIVGPGAGGREIQNGFHNIIGDTPNKGWRYQVRNTAVGEIIPERTWRIPVVAFSDYAVDALPSVAVGLGNLRTYGQVGLVFRFGQGLDSDFGVSRILPGLSGTDAYTPTRDVAWYVFGGVDGQAVGYDETLKGTTPLIGQRVHGVWDVGEFELGAAVMWHGVRVTYSQTWQTQEYRGSKSGLFNFGSLAASVRF